MLQPIRLPSAQEVLASMRLSGRLKDRERRGGKRAPLVCAAALYYVQAGTPRRISVKTFDISTGGLGFNSPEPLITGTKMLLRLTAAGANWLMLAECMHCSRGSHGHHRCGVSFIEVVSSQATPDIPVAWLSELGITRAAVMQNARQS